MAPLLRRKCTQKNHITMVDASTQTGSNSYEPIVLLEDICQEKATNKIKEQRATSQIPNQSTSYRVFAQPITNKENASSTRLTLTEQHSKKDSNLHCQKRKPKGIKPGPLCYKRRVANKENLRIPAAMSEIASSPPLKELETILERQLENTPQCRLHDDSVEEIVEVCSREIFTQTVNNSDKVQEALEENVNDVNLVNLTLRNNVGNLFNCGAENIRLQLDGITTITSTSSRNDRDANTDSGDEDEVRSGDEIQKGKYIKIQANTVHIHNHFYRSLL